MANRWTIAVTPTPTFQTSPPSLPPFLAETQNRYPAGPGGCLALAGPIADDGRSAHLTNLPWDHRQRGPVVPLRPADPAPGERLRGRRDGRRHLVPAQRFALQQGDPLATAPCLVVGAGTGLGMAIVLPEHGAWRIVAGEGGHVAFAPADEQQRRCGHSSISGMVASPGNGWFPAPGSPPSTNSSTGAWKQPKQLPTARWLMPEAPSVARWTCSSPPTAPLPATWRWPAWRAAGFTWPAASPPNCCR
jgi:hypothetical protein